MALDTHLVIMLRDLRPHRNDSSVMVDAVVEVKGESSPDLFVDFVKKAKAKIKAKALLNLNSKELDVYVGIWCGQAIFEIPKEFFDLISRQGWKVIVDLND